MPSVRNLNTELMEINCIFIKTRSFRFRFLDIHHFGNELFTFINPPHTMEAGSTAWAGCLTSGGLERDEGDIKSRATEQILTATAVCVQDRLQEKNPLITLDAPPSEPLDIFVIRLGSFSTKPNRVRLWIQCCTTLAGLQFNYSPSICLINNTHLGWTEKKGDAKDAREQVEGEYVNHSPSQSRLFRFPS